jgi:hypothetical protein
MIRLAWLNTSTYMSSFLRSVPEVCEAVRAHNAQKFEDNLEDWELEVRPNLADSEICGVVG